MFEKFSQQLNFLRTKGNLKRAKKIDNTFSLFLEGKKMTPNFLHDPYFLLSRFQIKPLKIFIKNEKNNLRR